MTGVSIDSKARFNFAQWCDGANGSDMDDIPRMPGVAVFIYSKSRGYITHVGYLEKPVDAGKPDGDWYVIEARGVKYGVVRTKLSERGWNRWGLMIKYFEYGDYRPLEYVLGGRTIKYGCTGADVKMLQETLIALGYSCGAYGADGDFGSATKSALTSFQRDEGIDDDGIFGPASYKALSARIDSDLPDSPDPDDTPIGSMPYLTVTGGSVNLRYGPDIDWPIIDVAHKGDKLQAFNTDDWAAVKSNDDSLPILWLSRKFVSESE